MYLGRRRLGPDHHVNMFAKARNSHLCISFSFSVLNDNFFKGLKGCFYPPMHFNTLKLLFSLVSFSCGDYILYYDINEILGIIFCLIVKLLGYRLSQNSKRAFKKHVVIFLF